MSTKFDDLNRLVSEVVWEICQRNEAQLEARKGGLGAFLRTLTPAELKEVTQKVREGSVKCRKAAGASHERTGPLRMANPANLSESIRSARWSWAYEEVLGMIRRLDDGAGKDGPIEGG